MARDPEKAKARKQRYLERKKIEKFGPAAAGQDMRGRHGNHARRERNARWNGGQMRTSEGYIALKVPDGHHLRQAHGYAYEHDLVMEEKLGRRLDTSREIVHHINGVRDDNRPENLELETRADHAREHTSVPGARDEFGRFNSNSRLRHSHGGNPDEWPEDLRVRQFPEVQ